MKITQSNKGSVLARNVSYSVVANLFSFLVSVTVVLLVPKAIGVVEYGYFQLFLFFISYVGFFHFGWCDGVILRYAGAEWDKLDRTKFSGQIYLFLFFEVSIWGFFSLAAFLTFGNDERLFVLLCTALGAIMVLLSTLLRFILQATNRIKVYAFLLLLERVVYLTSVVIVLVTGTKDFRFFVVAYLLAQVTTLAMAVWYCRSLIFTEAEAFSVALKEATTSLRIGSKLLLANISSMLIVGVVRFGIERVWGIATFGKISLLLSIISILFLFVNAASIALLPALRREDDAHFKAMYFPSRMALACVLLIAFVFSYPASQIVALWLPAYADVLVYLPLILPLCLFESAVSLLTGTYLKVVRREKDLFIGNFLGLLVSFVLFGISAFFLKNLALAVLSMPVALAVRSFLLERVIKKCLGISAMPVFATEVLASIAFISSAVFVDGYAGVLCYAGFLVFAFVVSRKTLCVAYKSFHATR